MSGYHVCCNQNKNSFFNEFSHLQHEEEFVDLTLAADGYLVKVHKNVIAVASPYLKEMLKSSASQSPVIFLNKVNHVILKYIIEYIYQGEVNVPVGILKEFVEVAKSLHINGIHNVDLKQLPKSGRKTIVEPVNNKRTNKKIAAHITINNENNSHSVEVQKCNEHETINIDSDFNDGIEKFETTDYVAKNVEDPPENRPINAYLPTVITEENNEMPEYSWSKKESLLQSSRDNIIENSEGILIRNVEYPPENRPINTVTLPTLNTAENNQISEYLWSKKGSLLQSSRDNIIENSEGILIQNVEYPPENRPINTVTLPTLNTAENNQISEYLWSKKGSLLQSSRDNIIENSEGILIQNVEYPPENRPINTVTLPTLNTAENNQISEYLWSKKGSLLQSSRDNIIENSEGILIQNVEYPPENRPINTVTLPTLNTAENNQISEYLWSKKGSLLQSSRDNIIENSEGILIQNVEYPPENRPINTVTLPTLNTAENNQISEYLWSKKGSLLQSSKDNIIDNSEGILIQNVEYPPENRPIDTLPNFNTEENNQISEYSWNKKRSLLQLPRDNIIENSESILIQNIKHKGKKLEIVIDATNATLNVTGTTLTEDITENTCIDTQNGLNDPENEIRGYRSADDLKNVNSGNKIVEEKDSMDYDDSVNTSIRVQPLTQAEAVTHLDLLNNIELDEVDMDDLRSMAQYTITQRGNTQLILNRYMYCCQFESRRGLRTRWRCIDYRRSRCPAMIEMENEKILKRTGAHGHGFHDKKIYKKHRKGLIFNTLQIAKKAYVDNPTQFVD